MLDIKRVIASAPRKPDRTELRPLFTPWGERIAAGDEDVAGKALHPHPQFERERFQLLDGWWDYAIVEADDAANAWQGADPPPRFDGRIRVPFSPEAPLSGVGRQLRPNELLWYRHRFPAPDEMSPRPAEADDRCMLHFEAVDYACACYCNGKPVGTHVGGYLPFAFDISEFLTPGENEITVCVHDPSDAGVQLRGKQRLERGGIWYTAQSGIWQTVWTEVVPKERMESLSIDAQADAGRLALAVTVRDEKADSRKRAAGKELSARLLDGDEVVARATSEAAGATPASLTGEAVAGPRTASDAGASVRELILDVPDPHLWSPEDPHLYRIELAYGRDQVSSYCAFRTVTMEEDEAGVKRLCVNHEPRFLRGVLDQGYWPDGLMTAPSDDALAFDVQTMKNLGFNMLRKHIKIEGDRWYYHCDRLGMLVWQDMVCGGSPPDPWHSSYKPTFLRRTWGRYADDEPSRFRGLASESDAFRTEWTETCAGAVGYLKNHPSIVTWVLFNEAWGQFEACKATELVRTLDPSRPIDAVSGWYDQACGDFLSVHNYFRPLEVYEDRARPKRAFAISEFGGLSHHVPDHSSLASSYGYGTFSDVDSFRTAVRDVLAQADKLEERGLAGFVYTQLSDVEEETNGLITYDRRMSKLGNGADL